MKSDSVAPLAASTTSTTSSLTPNVSKQTDSSSDDSNPEPEPEQPPIPSARTTNISALLAQAGLSRNDILCYSWLDYLSFQTETSSSSNTKAENVSKGLLQVVSRLSSPPNTDTDTDSTRRVELRQSFFKLIWLSALILLVAWLSSVALLLMLGGASGHWSWLCKDWVFCILLESIKFEASCGKSEHEREREHKRTLEVALLIGISLIIVGAVLAYALLWQRHWESRTLASDHVKLADIHRLERLAFDHAYYAARAHFKFKEFLMKKKPK